MTTELVAETDRKIYLLSTSLCTILIAVKFDSVGSMRILVLSLAVLSWFLVPFAVYAQKKTPGTEKFGAWSYVCEMPPGSSEPQCALNQNVVAEDRQEVGLSINMFRVVGSDAFIIRVLAPMGVLLTKGLGLYIDGKKIGSNVPFVRCRYPFGCAAEVLITNDLLTLLKSGKRATFSIFITPEEGIGLPVDLTGFEKGYGKLTQN